MHTSVLYFYLIQILKHILRIFFLANTSCLRYSQAVACSPLCMGCVSLKAQGLLHFSGCLGDKIIDLQDERILGTYGRDRM